MSKSMGEILLAVQIEQAGLPKPETEFKFHPTRKWRADFAYPERKVLIEVEGGVYARGRHTRGRGYNSDCEKYNAAVEMGYSVFRYTSSMVNDGSAIEQIVRVLNG